MGSFRSKIDNSSKKEIFFNVPDTEDYRVVCRFGYDHIVNFAWWGHLQKKVYYKKWIFFGCQKQKWVEIDSCWWSRDIKTRDDLKKAALEFYDESILLFQRLLTKAMGI